MRISTKGRYGLRALIDLATYGNGNNPVYLSDIAKRQGISEKYLEHIFSSLNRAGLVKSVRGRKGGYFLGVSAGDITLDTILNILEGPCTLVDCVTDAAACPKTDTCATRDVWRMLGSKIEEAMKGVTLANLAEKQKEKAAKDTLMYYI